MENTIRAIKAGDKDLFREVVVTYENKIYRYILKMLGQPAVAEDLTQEVFVTAYVKLNQYREANSFQAWLYRIAKNKTLNHIKRYSRESLFDQHIQQNLSYEDTYEEGFEDPRIEQALSVLKPEEKSLLVMKAVDEINYKELSEIFGRSEATLRKRYERIRHKVQRAYEGIEGGHVCQKLI